MTFEHRCLKLTAQLISECIFKQESLDSHKASVRFPQVLIQNVYLEFLCLFKKNLTSSPGKAYLPVHCASFSVVQNSWLLPSASTWHVYSQQPKLLRNEGESLLNLVFLEEDLNVDRSAGIQSMHCHFHVNPHPDVCGFWRIYSSPVVARSLAMEIHLKHTFPWKYPAGRNTLFMPGCIQTAVLPWMRLGWLCLGGQFAHLFYGFRCFPVVNDKNHAEFVRRGQLVLRKKFSVQLPAMVLGAPVTCPLPLLEHLTFNRSTC